LVLASHFQNGVHILYRSATCPVAFGGMSGASTSTFTCISSVPVFDKHYFRSVFTVQWWLESNYTFSSLREETVSVF